LIHILVLPPDILYWSEVAGQSYNFTGGAVGRAYHQLYQPIMPYKDELETLLSIPGSANKKAIRAKMLEKENLELREELVRLRNQLDELNNHK
jgi:dCMP deaminase